MSACELQESVSTWEMGNDCQGRRASGGEQLSPESEAEVEWSGFNYSSIPVLPFFFFLFF